jgi:alpha-L-arabinofuranosidase
VWPHPQYFVCQEYARCAGETAVRCEVQSEAYSAQAVGFIPPLPAVPYLDAAATRSESGVLRVFLVNRSLTRPLPVQVEWVGYQATSARATTLAGPRYDSTNDDPARTTVKPEERDVPGTGPLTVELPPCSLTVLHLAVARQGSGE